MQIVRPQQAFVLMIPKEQIVNIRALPSILRDDDSPLPVFKLWGNARTGLSSYYAPFEYINQDAKLILVGITPGGTQMNRALNAARSAIIGGTSVSEAIRHVKREGSFSGKMRPNIINTLNRLGYQQKLGLSCASALWSTDDHLVHFCSLLKFPVFLNGKDYNGNPKAHKDADLKKLLIEHFVPDMQAISPDALLVPLGDSVLEIVVSLKAQGLIPQTLMKFEGRYVAPPHPSGANAESIALLLENTYPDKEQYANQMYRDYLNRAPWEKKGGKPQSEQKYKAARCARWESMLFVRRAYKLQ